MCNPIAILAVTTAVSTAFTARSQIQQGKYKEKIAQYNARVAENQAQEVRRAGTEAENIKRRETAELLSRQQAQLGAAGIELGSGSALQLQESTVTFGEADALRIRSNTAAQISALQTGAELTRAQGVASKRAGYASATGTLLSGTAKFLGTGVADKWFTPESAAVVNAPAADPYAYGPAFT